MVFTQILNTFIVFKKKQYNIRKIKFYMIHKSFFDVLKLFVHHTSIMYLHRLSERN